MTDQDDGDEHAEQDDDEVAAPVTERTTAPQSAYTMGDVAFGAVVAFVGLLVTFGVPLLLA